MTKEQLKVQIDTAITNKTSAKSISPINVGGNMKNIIDLIPISDGSETKIVAGDNVTVTGEGTTVTPYVVNSTVDVSSGTYTPTIINVTNVSGILPQLSRYTIIGKIVTVNVGFDFSAITANLFSQITITLPVNRSNSHSSNIGSGAVQPLFQGVISAIVQTDDVSFARCSFNAGSLGSYVGHITFTYSTN